MKSYEEYTQENWDKLTGYDWSYLLSDQPQLSEFCDWNKLDGYDWRCLLKHQPQFDKHCNWNELDGYDWCLLLSDQPQFGKYCDWSKLNGHHWRFLLTHQPQLSEFCDWSKLDGEDWCWLLIKQPQFSEHCDWSKLDGFDWSRLLTKQPQFSSKRKHKYSSLQEEINYFLKSGDVEIGDIDLGFKVVSEEFNEFKEAYEKRDTPNMLKEASDIVYTMFNMFAHLGYNGDEVVAMVVDNNKEKVPHMFKNEYGKLVVPDDIKKKLKQKIKDEINEIVSYKDKVK